MKKLIKPQICSWLCVSVKDGLYQSRDQIYPENNLTLTCNTKVNDSITWKKNGYDLVPSDRILIFKTTLVVKETTPNDSGKYKKILLLPCYCYTTTIKTSGFSVNVCEDHHSLIKPLIYFEYILSVNI